MSWLENNASQRNGLATTFRAGRGGVSGGGGGGSFLIYSAGAAKMLSDWACYSSCGKNDAAVSKVIRHKIALQVTVSFTLFSDSFPKIPKVGWLELAIDQSLLSRWSWAVLW